MYKLTIHTRFSAAHFLQDYPGACAQVHGHNWKVEVRVQAEELDESGMAIDFHDLKARTREIVEGLDHRYLNDLPAFQRQNPTAENIARLIFEEARALHLPVAAVRLWETRTACAEYRE